MSQKPKIESIWSWILEWILFVLNIGGAATLAIGGFAGLGGYVGVQILLIPVFILMYLASFLAIFFDIRKIKRESRGDLEWDPSTVLYLVGALFFVLAVWQYLYVRHKKTSMPTSSPKWIYGVLSTFLIGVGGSILGDLAGLNSVTSLSSGVFLLLPIFIYKDAAYVRSLSLKWSPNPINYHFATTFFFGLLTIFIAPYYLYKRNKYVRGEGPQSKEMEDGEEYSTESGREGEDNITETSASGQKECSECGNKLEKENASYCGSCGAEIQSKDESYSGDQSTKKPRSRQCPECGNRLEKWDANYCGSCGTEI
jgi:DNA-directed RNA polymerase subunit RPC12/RpoP